MSLKYGTLAFFLILLFRTTSHSITINLPMSNTDKKNIVYLLPGLGLSPKIFERLTIQADEIHYLNWIEPQKKETLSAYAARLAAKISPTEDNIILIGHSFGGITVQEISKIIPTKQIILLSSVKKKTEKSAAMNFWMRAFPIHQLAGQKLIISSFKSWGKAHGYKSPAAQEVFIESAKQHSSYYFKWATTQVCKWDSEGITTPIAHIHGSKDKTFPAQKLTAPVQLVDGGDHIMLYNQPVIVSDFINQTIASLSN